MTSTLLQQAVEAPSDERILEIAHRTASRYTHRSDPTEHSYGFVRHTLLDFARKVLAESALQQQPEPVAWRPIESAPKDGREVILRNGDRVGAGCWVKWPASYDMDGCEEREGGESWSVGFDGDLWEGDKAPTHWQPLPAAAPPALQQQEEPREVAQRGQFNAAVALLRECIGPLEVSAGLIESDDGDEMEYLIGRVRKFVKDADVLAASPSPQDFTLPMVDEGKP